MSLKIEKQISELFPESRLFCQGYKDIPTKVLTKGSALDYLNKHYIVRHEETC